MDNWVQKVFVNFEKEMLDGVFLYRKRVVKATCFLESIDEFQTEGNDLYFCKESCTAFVPEKKRQISIRGNCDTLKYKY